MPLPAGVPGPTVPSPPGVPVSTGQPAGWPRSPAGPTVWLPVAAAAVVLAADVSGLSKAEVERIWLPFAVWLLVATVRLPQRHRRWWLGGQAVTALAVNHLLATVS